MANDDKPHTDTGTVLFWLRVAYANGDNDAFIKMSEGFSSRLRERFVNICEVLCATTLDRVRLTDEERMALELVYRVDMTRDEAAEIMHMSLPTLKNRIYAAARKIGEFVDLEIRL